MSRERILLTDADDRATLAAARALVAAGYDVHVVAGARLSLAGTSRSVRSHVVTQNALEDAPAFVREVGHVADRVGAAVLLPMTDQSIQATLQYRSLLPANVRMPLPDLASYEAASDKIALLELAAAAGFATPYSLVLKSARDPVPSIPESSFPAVLKPHRSIVLDGGRRRKVGVAFVDRPAQLSEALRALPEGAFPILLQQRVEGVGEGFFALRWGGRPIAAFAHRRLREKPPAGGVSVYRESIALDEAMVDSGLRLLDALNWRGVAMIECKRDLNTGRHVIMEVNGRFWGSLQLAIDAGIDFPTLLVRCALGQEPRTQSSYRIGIRSRWFWGDVDHLYLRLTRSPAALHLGNGHQSRLAALIEFLQFRPRRDHSEIWRWRDPAPFLVETLQRLRLAR